MERLIIILTLLLTLAGCTTRYEMVETLLECQNISLSWKGTMQVDFDPETYQIGYNSARYEYRVYDDRLAYWFSVRCSEMPVSEGQTFSADVAWTGKNTTKEIKGIRLTVKKTDPAGLVWLWNQSDRIGIVIKNNI